MKTQSIIKVLCLVICVSFNATANTNVLYEIKAVLHNHETAINKQDQKLFLSTLATGSPQWKHAQATGVPPNQSYKIKSVRIVGIDNEFLVSRYLVDTKDLDDENWEIEFDGLVIFKQDNNQWLIWEFVHLNSNFITNKPNQRVDLTVKTPVD